MTMDINQAIQAVPRKHFVPGEVRSQAHIDVPLPIGFDQTISQPTTVKCMLSWLNVQPGDKILDVGSGSGWTTALLSHLTGDNGSVYAVERIPELVTFGQRNCDGLGISNASFHRASDTYGLPEYAPYNRILVSAAANDLPDELTKQLTPNGKLVIPINDDIIEYQNQPDQKPIITVHHGYRFVPLRPI